MKKIILSLVVTIFIFAGCGSTNPNVSLVVEPDSYTFNKVSNLSNISAPFVLRVLDKTQEEPLPLENYKIIAESPFVYGTGEGCTNDKNNAWGEFHYPDGTTADCPAELYTDSHGEARIVFVFYPRTITEQIEFDISFYIKGGVTQDFYKIVEISASPD